MEIRKIETGKIPTSIASGDKIKPIPPVNPVNNNREPNPEWKKEEPGNSNSVDTMV